MPEMWRRNGHDIAAPKNQRGSMVFNLLKISRMSGLR